MENKIPHWLQKWLDEGMNTAILEESGCFEALMNDQKVISDSLKEHTPELLKAWNDACTVEFNLRHICELISTPKDTDSTDMRLEIYSLGGNCPVQSEGKYQGRVFYFRARGNHMSMTIATEGSFTNALVDDKAWYYEETFGDTPFVAGWADVYDCLVFMLRAFVAWDKEHENTFGKLR